MAEVVVVAISIDTRSSWPEWVESGCGDDDVIDGDDNTSNSDDDDVLAGLVRAGCRMAHSLMR